jgi:hypothetical protein
MLLQHPLPGEDQGEGDPITAELAKLLNPQILQTCTLNGSGVTRKGVVFIFALALTTLMGKR